MTKPQIIFLGNGPLADNALAILQHSCKIVFHAHRAADLAEVAMLRCEDPSLHAVLASFGVIIPPEILELFEPEGIFNIHPSLLPKYRGPSPIETAILNGDTEFGVSVMKLVSKMDAGPIYWQKTFTFPPDADKLEVYRDTAAAGARWIVMNLDRLPPTRPQNDRDATFTPKLTTSLAKLHPDQKTALELLNQIRAYQGWPRSKYTYNGVECTILVAHVAETDENSPLALLCQDGAYLIPDRLQPASKKPMNAQSFLNGYYK